MTAQHAFSTLRTAYHDAICRDILGKRGEAFSNADKDSRASRDIAEGLARRVGAAYCAQPPAAQSAGTLFARHTLTFLRDAFALLQPLRPGDWRFSSEQRSIAVFDQYEHINALERLVQENRNLRATLGGDYLVDTDITVSRAAISDAELASAGIVLGPDARVARFSPTLARNHGATPLRILHASISCKWTMRSDRAQNTRTEALNLIRNRKGRAPHMLAVTFEPLPKRISSIAMGTGDLDCTYHAALPELLEAVHESGAREQVDVLETLIEGRRLRDISDIPFDLAA